MSERVNTAYGYLRSKGYSDFAVSGNRPLWNEVTKGVPEQFHGSFTNSQSEAEAWGTRKRIDAQLDLSRRIEAGGWSAKAGAFMGEMLEPVGLAASFIVPEVAKAVQRVLERV